MMPLRPARRAFTIIEAAMSMLIVALMLAGAIAVGGASARARDLASRRDTACALADALLDEIRQLQYREPGTTTLGPDAGETALNRSTFDDVDDFHGLSDSPPRDRGGTVLPGLTHWSRSVRVQWVALSDAQTADSFSGLKRITITVSHRGKEVLTRTTLRSMAR